MEAGTMEDYSLLNNVMELDYNSYGVVDLDMVSPESNARDQQPDYDQVMMNFDNDDHQPNPNPEQLEIEMIDDYEPEPPNSNQPQTDLSFSSSTYQQQPTIITHTSAVSSTTALRTHSTVSSFEGAATEVKASGTAEIPIFAAVVTSEPTTATSEPPSEPLQAENIPSESQNEIPKPTSEANLSSSPSDETAGLSQVDPLPNPVNPQHQSSDTPLVDGQELSKELDRSSEETLIEPVEVPVEAPTAEAERVLSQREEVIESDPSAVAPQLDQSLSLSVVEDPSVTASAPTHPSDLRGSDSFQSVVEEVKLEQLSYLPVEDLPYVDDEYENRPKPRRDLLELIEIAPGSLSTRADVTDADEERAPGVRLICEGCEYSLFRRIDSQAFAEKESGDPALGADDQTILLSEVEYQDLYYGPVEAFIQSLHRIFPNMNADHNEFVLNFPDLEIKITEDNVYTKELSLFDFDRLHVGARLPNRLLVCLEKQPRLVHCFNVLAAYVVKISTGEIIHDEEQGHNLAALEPKPVNTSTEGILNHQPHVPPSKDGDKYEEPTASHASSEAGSPAAILSAESNEEQVLENHEGVKNCSSDCATVVVNGVSSVITSVAQDYSTHGLDPGLVACVTAPKQEDSEDTGLGSVGAASEVHRSEELACTQEDVDVSSNDRGATDEPETEIDCLIGKLHSTEDFMTQVNDVIGACDASNSLDAQGSSDKQQQSGQDALSEGEIREDQNHSSNGAQVPSGYPTGHLTKANLSGVSPSGQEDSLPSPLHTATVLHRENYPQKAADLTAHNKIFVAMAGSPQNAGQTPEGSPTTSLGHKRSYHDADDSNPDNPQISDSEMKKPKVC